MNLLKIFYTGADLAKNIFFEWSLKKVWDFAWNYKKRKLDYKAWLKNVSTNQDLINQRNKLQTAYSDLEKTLEETRQERDKRPTTDEYEFVKKERDDYKKENEVYQLKIETLETTCEGQEEQFQNDMDNIEEKLKTKQEECEKALAREKTIETRLNTLVDHGILVTPLVENDANNSEPSISNFNII